MTRGVILVDFDNVFYGRELSSELIKYMLEQFIYECLSVNHEVEYIDIRLYGGWKCDSVFTKYADKVLGYMESVNNTIFPYIYKGQRIGGMAQLVTSQFHLDIEWQNTMQEKRGRHFLKASTTSTNVCSHDPMRCPVHMIANATRGMEVVCPISGCGHIDVSQLIRMEQKMVDSMMTCDILEFVRERDYIIVEVVSDDVDLHPAIALAGERYVVSNNVDLILLVRNQRKSDIYSKILGLHNVNIRLLQ